MTTLREKAAIAAMQGLLANPNESMYAVAANACFIADALQAQLERTARKPQAGKDPKVCTPMERALLIRLDDALRDGSANVSIHKIFDIARNGICEIRAEAEALAKQEASK